MPFSPDRLITLEIKTKTLQAALLQGLEIWMNLGLIHHNATEGNAAPGKLNLAVSNAGIQFAATGEVPLSTGLQQLQAWKAIDLLSNSTLSVAVKVSSSHPLLLAGLDQWLQLGLLSDFQIRQICQDNLCSPLPQPLTTNQPTAEPAAIQGVTVPRRRQANPMTQMMQSLMAELSVVWLLLLGVFMVIVSSGVLAATQWQKFPSGLQYSILLAYTLIFGGISLWAKNQPRLQLTAQALRVITLLLVPVNFFAMDSFRLWQNPLDWGVVGIAAIALTVLTRRLLYPHPGNLPTPTQWLLINHLGLSYLHWGWRLWGWGLMAVYVGMIGTAAITTYRRRQFRQNQGDSSTLPPATKFPVSLNQALIVYAILVLLVRAIFIDHIEIAQLGLALGICGTLLFSLGTQAETSPESRLMWERIGATVLCLGWICSFEAVPWQALAVSVLGLFLCWRHLQTDGKRSTFALFFLIGLQMHWLIRQMIPATVRQTAVTVGTELTAAQNHPFALWSITLLPYLMILVVLAEFYQRRQQLRLAEFARGIALALGTSLTLLSLPNPILRTLNLTVSTLILGGVTKVNASRDTFNASLSIYLTHIGGLLTLISAIDGLMPRLMITHWASILLVLMGVEWQLLIINKSDEKNATLWRQSCWYLGLGLAGFSYWLLLVNTSIHLPSYDTSQLVWGLAGFVIPLALTAVAMVSSSRFPAAGLTSGLSVAALIMMQPLTLALPGLRLTGFAIAFLVMLVNTRLLCNSFIATITMGFGLCMTMELLHSGGLGIAPVTVNQWLLVGAITTFVLWGGQDGFASRSTPLAAVYSQATHVWALFLCFLTLIALTVHSIFTYWGLIPATTVSLSAIVVMIAAMLYHGWRHPHPAAVYGISWGIELLLVEGLSLTDRSLFHLSIANIALGLITQLLGDWWWRRYSPTEASHPRLSQSWQVIPLVYGALGAALRFGSFTHFTGLTTLGLALIAVGVGRRSPQFKPLIYLAAFGISAAAYEILLYQIAAFPLGDQLIGMATLAASILYGYRILSPWLRDYLHLSQGEFQGIANLHWGLGSFLLAASTLHPAVGNPGVGLGTGVLLTRYAIMQGRHSSDGSNQESAMFWSYLGIGEAIGVISYAYHQLPLPWLQLLNPWSVAIVTIAAYFLYISPWEAWGWPLQPWHQVALGLPLLTIAMGATTVSSISLLLAAAFYIMIAVFQRQPRITYISVGLFNWVLWRWLWQWQITDSVVYTTLLGASVLYVAHLDPTLRQPSQRESRHWLRILGTGIICGVALMTHSDTGILPGIFSIIAIFGGLAFRVRAFLYVGTSIFAINAFYQLVILITHYPFLKWVIGLMVGIAFISIAATFERSREQITLWVKNWMIQLQDWQ